MLTFNEGKACDAIIRYLETRASATRENVRFPEQDAHQFPVEIVCDIGRTLFAFEHTGIEPFEGHMQLEAEAKSHIGPIQTRLAGTLPQTETFELQLPAKVFSGRKRTEIGQIQEAIIAWVKETAPTLPIRSYADYIGDIQKASPPGVPFPIRLFRFQSGMPGYLMIKHIVSGQEQSRVQRIQTACDKKFPKLDAWKRSEGARSVLILEDNDIQLTNQAVVAEVFLPIARSRPDRPDETYLVATCLEPWRVWPILIDDATYFDFATNCDGGWEIDQSSLSVITRR